MVTTKEVARKNAEAKVFKPEISDGLAKSFAAQFMEFRKVEPDATLDNYLEGCGITMYRELYVKAVQPHVIPVGSTWMDSGMEECNVGSMPH